VHSRTGSSRTSAGIDREMLAFRPTRRGGLLLVLAVLGVTAAMALGSCGGASTTTVTTTTSAGTTTTAVMRVPTVIGKDQTRAETILRDAGFKVAVSSAPNPAKPNTVLAQDPTAGSLAAEGETVTLTVSTSERPRASAPQQPDELWGFKFTSTAVTEGGEPRPLVRDTHIRLGFIRHGRRNGVGWSAGCNSTGAKAWVTADELHLRHLVSTLIGCPRDLQHQDKWLSEFFRSDPSWRLSDRRLTLTSGGTVIELEEADH
jgi:heat shock protein HslJ